MSNKWRGLHGPITVAAAEAEPLSEQMFGPSYDARQRKLKARQQDSRIDRQTYQPWKKPRMERVK